MAGNMAKLSITTAWNEAVEILKRDFGALFTIALALMALPSVLLQALGPGRVGPGEVPGPGYWMLAIPVVLLLSIAGSIAIASLALGRERVVGSAIAHGFRRFLPMLGAVLILLVPTIIVIVALVQMAGLQPQALLNPTPATVGKMALVFLLFFVVALYFGTRLMLMTPVAAAETAGPVDIIRRSWALTRGHFWKLLGFVLLLAVAAIVIMIVVNIVIGLLIAAIAGLPEPGSLAALLILLLGGLVNAAFSAVFGTIVARVYVQLAGDAESTGRVFE
ncbi:MAG: glycerophosphoryl diester phosphodiesterase membrane domain-containing protein [Allosphingosinicella sp.]